MLLRLWDGLARQIDEGDAGEAGKLLLHFRVIADDDHDGILGSSSISAPVFTASAEGCEIRR